MGQAACMEGWNMLSHTGACVLCCLAGSRMSIATAHLASSVAGFWAPVDWRLPARNLCVPGVACNAGKHCTKTENTQPCLVLDRPALGWSIIHGMSTSVHQMLSDFRLWPLLLRMWPNTIASYSQEEESHLSVEGCRSERRHKCACPGVQLVLCSASVGRWRLTHRDGGTSFYNTHDSSR